MNDDKQSNLMKSAQVAELLGISTASLARWRMLGQGPQFVKLLRGHRQGMVRYRGEDVSNYINDSLYPAREKHNYTPLGSLYSPFS